MDNSGKSTTPPNMNGPRLNGDPRLAGRAPLPLSRPGAVPGARPAGVSPAPAAHAAPAGIAPAPALNAPSTGAVPPETQKLPSGVAPSSHVQNANPAKELTPLEVENLKNLSADPEIDVEAPQASLPVGMKIDDRYEIVSVLGVGGFATVYRARHLTIDRDVALKVMDIKKGVDPSYAERFYREAKIAAKIHHNNVVAIYDFGHVSETKQPYIAMEMLHGHDLSHELSEAGPLSPKRAFVLFRPVLEALAQGHRLGIIHKDLKPENLYLVDPRGQHELMKVLDFGVARINSNEVAKLTSASQLLGTPRYLAPEYIKTQSVSPAIDVYQMALILSEALTGIPAVSGDPFHSMMLHCSGQLQIAEFLLEGPVGEVFRKAISIDPAERYQDCEAFGEALDSISEYFDSNVPLEGGAPQLTPDSRISSKMTAMPFGPNGSVGMGGNDAQLNQPGYPPKKKKSILPIIITLVLVVLVIVVFAAIAVTQKQEKEDEKAKLAAALAANEDKEVSLSLDSIPQGARIDLNGIETICEVTPCTWKSTENQLKTPMSLVFKIEGYKPQTYKLDSESFASTNGMITVELEEQDKELIDLEFTLEYEPANATVTDIESKETVCTGSPCPYTLKNYKDKGFVALKFSAPGYRSVTENLAKRNYDETEGIIKITLEKEAPRPAKSANKGQQQAAEPIVITKEVVVEKVVEKEKVVEVEKEKEKERPKVKFVQ